MFYHRVKYDCVNDVCLILFLLLLLNIIIIITKLGPLNSSL